MGRFLKQIHHNGIALGLILILWRVRRVLVSRVYSRVLGAPSLDIGPGCRVKGLRYIKFGTGISMFRHAWIEAVYEYEGKHYSPQLIIGDGVTMSSNVHISCVNSVTLGSNVLLGSNIYISDHNHGVYHGAIQSSPLEMPSARVLSDGGTIQIGDNVWIGDNVVIVGTVRVGDGAIIGANSVVLSDVAGGAIVAGAPARSIKQFNPTLGAWEPAGKFRERNDK
jgi:lipopolysaccharide O-acetyltransferase